ncbi:MAG: hypothetical protein HQL23_01170 [Candidatus Omnitrophica bacterium]|nr:hypothetical protein [Candidatus Omnitrophota bacterium]
MLWGLGALVSTSLARAEITIDISDHLKPGFMVDRTDQTTQKKRGFEK